MNVYKYKNSPVVLTNDIFKECGIEKDYNKIVQAIYNNIDAFVEGEDYVCLVKEDLAKFIEYNYIKDYHPVKLKLWSINGLYKLSRVCTANYGYKILDLALKVFPPSYHGSRPFYFRPDDDTFVKFQFNDFLSPGFGIVMKSNNVYKSNKDTPDFEFEITPGDCVSTFPYVAQLTKILTELHPNGYYTKEYLMHLLQSGWESTEINNEDDKIKPLYLD